MTLEKFIRALKVGSIARVRIEQAGHFGSNVYRLFVPLILSLILKIPGSSPEAFVYLSRSR